MRPLGFWVEKEQKLNVNTVRSDMNEMIRYQEPEFNVDGELSVKYILLSISQTSTVCQMSFLEVLQWPLTPIHRYIWVQQGPQSRLENS